jgi:CBS domain-containing protein
LSPRAACRLETLGFEEVYDYVLGKMDWLARGELTEGTQAGVPRVKDALRHDVVTCALGERVGEVMARVEDSPYGFALATSESGILLGRLRRSRCEGKYDASVDEVMEEGPSTVRPDADAAKLAQRLVERDLRTAVVTTPEGRLMGVVRRTELVRPSQGTSTEHTDP